MHSCEALPQAYWEYITQKMRPAGRTFAYAQFPICEIVVVFRKNNV